MKKNKMMRTAAVLGVAALLTTSALSGTLAKYTTQVSSEDSARVATWGFTQSSIDISELFKDAYDNENVQGDNKTNVIAPGTSNSVKFSFTYAGQEKAPEVAYTFKVDTTGSSCAEDIKKNTNIQWKLDNGTWGTWDAMITAIEALDGNIKADETAGTPDDYYKPGTLPTAFPGKGENQHTVAWRWVFDENVEDGTKANKDSDDTALGNKDTLDNVTLKITITATQID